MKCLLCGAEIKTTEYKDCITHACTGCSWQCNLPKKSIMQKDENNNATV